MNYYAFRLHQTNIFYLKNQQSPYSPILIQHVATQGTFSYSSSFLKRAMKFWRNLQVDMRYGLLPCLLQVPKTFVTVQIFWGRPNVWLHLVPLQKLLCWHKNWIYSLKIFFWCGTKCLWPVQYKFMAGLNFLFLTKNWLIHIL